MKLKLQKGKQKEIIYQEKGLMTWKQFANKLNVSIHILKSISVEKVLISEELFSKCSRSKQYLKFIEESLPDNWGQKKGGNLSSGNLQKTRHPSESKELAELIGIILGDGNIHIHKKSNNSYMLRIVGDSEKDKEYLLNYVKPLCENLFQLKCKIHKHNKFKELFLIVNSKQVVEFLISKGLVSGNKIANKVRVPKWIKNNDEYYAACIRGLMDTDGSIYRLLPHWPNLFQICFTNRNMGLLEDVKCGLEKLGIVSSKICTKANSPKIYITQKESIRKFYKVVSFKNPRHLVKIQPRGVVD